MSQHTYFLLIDNAPSGPYSEESVRRMWYTETIDGRTLCRAEGTDKWIPLQQFAAEWGIKMPVIMPVMPSQTVSTEQTPKKLKLLQAVGVLMMLAGLVMLFSSWEVGRAFLAVGVVWYCVVRILIWWRHR